MRQIIRAAPAVVLTSVLTGVVTAVLAAGCSAGPAAVHRATVDTCYAFSVRALQRHVTVTSVPRACRGLSHAQINQAVGGAIHRVVGPRPKAAARRLASRDSAYLGHLVGSVPPPRPASLATGRAQPASDLGASLVALAAWVLTAAAGSYLLAGWLAPGWLAPGWLAPGWSGRRRARRAAALPPVILLGHFAVAVAGLGIWIAFVVTDTAALAWAAVGLILPAAGLGMAGLAAALPEASPGAPPASAPPASAPPSTRMPVAAVAVHGLLATATILAVVLAAIGAP